MNQRLGLAAAAAIMTLSGSVGAQQAVKPMRDHDVVARVNGTAIYRKAVREVVQGVLSLEDSPPDPSAVGHLAEDALNSLIAMELLYQESQARGITVSDKSVGEEIARSRARFPDAHAFEQALQAKGMSEEDLRRETRKTLAVNQLLEAAIWKNVHVSADQVKSFYEKNREEFKHPAEVRASRILTRLPEGATAAERGAGKQRAGALLAKLRAGTDFAQVARESSQDPASALQGGDLGYLAKGEMDPAFEKQAWTLAPGQLSDVVVTPYGFEIIKVTDRRGAGYQAIEEVQDRIRAVLIRTEKQERQAEFVARLRQKAAIELVQPVAP